MSGPQRCPWWPFRMARGNRRTRAVAATVDAPEVRSPAAPSRGRSLRRVGRIVIIVLAPIIVLVGGWGVRRWILHSPHFAVRQVRISPTIHTSADDLRARAAVPLGENLFSVDLDAVARDVQADPWVARARARRELPATIAVDVVEREPACVVSLGPLYLATTAGEVFKRASIDEAAAYPVITGVPRDGYVDDREATQALIREGLAVLSWWQEPVTGWRGERLAPRPAIGEIHLDAALGVTLYTFERGVGIRLGRGDPTEMHARLQAFDRVWQALLASKEQPRMILVDQRAQTGRVTVRLAPREVAKPAEDAIRPPVEEEARIPPKT